MQTENELIQVFDDELRRDLVLLALNYKGQYDDLSHVVGTVVLARLFGWKVARLCSSKGEWELACKVFGDLKESNPEEGPLAYRSFGYELVKKAGDFWAHIRRHKIIPVQERRSLI